MAHTVGQSLKRVDAEAKVKGAALYPGDLTRPGMLYMKVLFSAHPHARILRIDTARAEAAPGVIAVLTADDVPNNIYGIAEYDQPVLASDVVRCVGDRVALVIAETEEQAAAARALIDVEYDVLPAICTPDEAMAEGAPLLHPGKGSNVLASYHVRKGEVETALAGADVVIEETYEIGGQEHLYLQPDAGLAWIDVDGTVVVETAGQWAHDDQRQIANSLGLPEEKVRVVYPAIGGAFGGREDISVQILLGLAAYRVNRPVKLIWSRPETTIGHHKRHPMRIHEVWGATRDGRLVAQKIDILADAGAYTSTSESVVQSAVLAATGPYDVPNVSIDARPVYTNNLPSGAFRGFGVAQATVAYEGQMSRLAAALEMDPVELRHRNLLHEGSVMSTQAVLPPGLSAEATLKAAAEAAGWTRENGAWRRQRGGVEVRAGVWRGVGFVSGWKNVGYTHGFPETSTAEIVLHGSASIDCAEVHLAAAEVGQGIHTAILQMAAEALDLPVERIELVVTDTGRTRSAGSVSASRMAFMAGNALRGAAEAARSAWDDEERPADAVYTYHAPLTEEPDEETGAGNLVFAFAYLAQAVEVEVDTGTGQVAVTRIVAAHDVGKAINPMIVEGQIHGGAIQGLGWATIEDFVTREGRVLSPNLSTYLIPTIMDVPETFDALILEEHQPIGPWGVTGMGEMPLIGIPPAIIDAIHDATGVWVNGIPLTPSRVLAALAKG